MPTDPLLLTTMLIASSLIAPIYAQSQTYDESNEHAQDCKIRSRSSDDAKNASDHQCAIPSDSPATFSDALLHDSAPSSPDDVW